MRYRDLIEQKDSGNSKTCVGNQRGIYPEEIDADVLKGLNPKEVERKKKQQKWDEVDEYERLLATTPTVDVTGRHN